MPGVERSSRAAVPLLSRLSYGGSTGWMSPARSWKWSSAQTVDLAAGRFRPFDDEKSFLADLAEMAAGDEHDR
jgi:hypothetical protein